VGCTAAELVDARDRSSGPATSRLGAVTGIASTDRWALNERAVPQLPAAAAVTATSTRRVLLVRNLTSYLTHLFEWMGSRSMHDP
jgi:hypothetical protein